MRLTLIFGFFLSLNFLLLLFPRMMPNIISVESTLFWYFWVNGMFFLTLLLPTRASYMFSPGSSTQIASKAIYKQLSTNENQN